MCDVSGKKIFWEATVLTVIHMWMDIVGTPGKSSSIYTCKNKLCMLNHIISLSLQLQDCFVVVHSLQKFQLVMFLHCYVIFIMGGRASYKAGQNLHLSQRLTQAKNSTMCFRANQQFLYDSGERKMCFNSTKNFS